MAVIYFFRAKRHRFSVCNFPFCLMDFLPWIYKCILYSHHTLFILLLIGSAVALDKLQPSYSLLLYFRNMLILSIPLSTFILLVFHYKIHFYIPEYPSVTTILWHVCMLKWHCHFLQDVISFQNPDVLDAKKMFIWTCLKQWAFLRRQFHGAGRGGGWFKLTV